MKMNASAEPEKQSQYKANSNPIPERPKMNENLFATKVYENITTFGLRQNKPNFIRHSLGEGGTNPNKPNLSRPGLRLLWLIFGLPAPSTGNTGE